MPTPSRPGAFFCAWIAIVAIAAADIVLCRRAEIVVSGWGELGAACAIIGGVALLYGLSGRSPILSRLAHWALLWILMSAGCAVMTYAAAALGGPLADAHLARTDAALGLDWVGWHDFVCARPLLRLVLAVIYVSLMPQILFTLFFCGLTRRNRRNAEFFLLTTASLLVTILVSWRVPALGAAAFHGYPEDVGKLYLDDLLALRAHRLHALSLADLKGIIQFPSFHTALAVLFPYVHRGHRRVAPVVLGLNVALLFSIPVAGGHHFTDMIAGAAIALATILVGRVVERRLGSARPSSDEETLATPIDLGSS